MMLFQEAKKTDIESVIREAAQVVLTKHARQRMAQRNVSLHDVLFVSKYGKLFHKAGAVFVHLRKRDIPKEKQRDQDITRLEGMTVVISRRTVFAYAVPRAKDNQMKHVILESPIVITVWRNRQYGLRHIRSKPRYGSHRWF